MLRLAPVLIALFSTACTKEVELSDVVDKLYGKHGRGVAGGRVYTVPEKYPRRDLAGIVHACSRGDSNLCFHGGQLIDAIAVETQVAAIATRYGNSFYQRACDLGHMLTCKCLAVLEHRHDFAACLVRQEAASGQRRRTRVRPKNRWP